MSGFPLIRPLVCALAVLLGGGRSLAQFDPGAGLGFGAAAEPATRATLVSEVKTIAPGETFAVALKLEHPDGWHSYYRNTGGVELPPDFRWSLPDGFSQGPVGWPVPEVKDGYFGKSFVHSGSPVFLFELRAPASLAAGTSVTLKLEASWQICAEACLNESKSFALTLPVAAKAGPDPAAAEVFAKARGALPAKADGWCFTIERSASGYQVKATAPVGYSGTPADFVPDQPFVRAAGDGGSIRREGDVIFITLQRGEKDATGGDLAEGDAVSGILTGPQAVAVPLTKLIAAPAAPVAWGRFLWILAGMLGGGLVLNLMPCVFPVIGLKIMGFVQQAGSDRRKIVLHGLVFALGVLLSFAVLSGILFVAKLGWGYQLQNPWVVLALMLLMFVLALNMYGVFEIGASATSVGGSLQMKQGLAGSFFSGVLATVVATPCSAPFLGTAIGAAIGLPAIQFFPAFGAMALGLALPYLVLSVFPHLVERLPRPGPWMESFKQGMSFLLFATAGYLLWVYAGLIDLENLLNPVLGLSCIAVAAWIHGRWNLPGLERRTRVTAASLAIAFAAAGAFLAKPPKPSSLDWQPWSAALVEESLEAGKPVYLDFTATWCVTCQVNKKRAYNREVVERMKELGVVTLKADKTKPNPDIEKALRKLGRTAIPVNVLYAPGKDPVILPELLGPGDVLEALKDLKAPAP